MRIRVTRLKETRKSTRVAFIDDRVRLLDCIDTVPLSSKLAHDPSKA
jgi:pimeloyl-CoA synthetase